MLPPEPNTSPAICANEPIAALDGLEVSTAAKAAPPPAWLSLERPGEDEKVTALAVLPFRTVKVTEGSVLPIE